MPLQGELIQEPVYPSNRVARSLDLFLYRGSREGWAVVLDGVIQLLVYELPRIPIPRTRVNRKCSGAESSTRSGHRQRYPQPAPRSCVRAYHAEERFGAMVVRDTLSDGDHHRPQLLDI